MSTEPGNKEILLIWENATVSFYEEKMSKWVIKLIDKKWVIKYLNI